MAAFFQLYLWKHTPRETGFMKCCKLFKQNSHGLLTYLLSESAKRANLLKKSHPQAIRTSV